MQKEGEFKREEVEKYMFFIRAACLSADEATSWKVSITIFRCSNVVKASRGFSTNVRSITIL